MSGIKQEIVMPAKIPVPMAAAPIIPATPACSRSTLLQLKNVKHKSLVVIEGFPYKMSVSHNNSMICEIIVVYLLPRTIHKS